MALPSRLPVLNSSYTPFHQKQTSNPVKFKNITFASAFTPGNWNITQDYTMASTDQSICLSLTNRHVDTKDEFALKHERKMSVFKHMLRKERENAYEVLHMIDALQRLGIDYHFQDEIDAALQRQLPSSSKGDDLHQLSLRFRLLRQEGYHVSAGVFDKFKDKEGKFKQNLNDDIEGLMELYEASQLSIGGDDHVLDEARDHSYQLLNSWMTRLDYPQARVVRHALDYPHHKNFARFMAANFSTDFRVENGCGWVNELQELAKIDSKIVQSRCRHEILQISRWWTDLGISKELKFARNQPLKWYIWSMATVTDRSLSEQRIDLTKAISFIYIIDDIFDVHGTLEELALFTEVVDRWDADAADRLPDYMRICFRSLDTITNEISDKVYKQYGWNPVHSLRKTWGSLCKAFLVEARWFASGHLPNAEEYLQNGIVSSGVHVVLVHIFYLLGHGVTEEGVEFIDNDPALISSTATILRLWDDLGSATDEDQDGNDGSYIECYMKENKGSSVENARKQVINMISEAWKQLNKECLFPNPFSRTLTKSCLNLARMVPLMYSYDANQHLPVLEQHVKSLLLQSTSS